jgi:PhnB protein
MREMTTVSTHLTFSGQCQAAFRFYERCLNARIVTMLSYGETPMAAQVPPGWRDKIVHANLQLGEQLIAGADVLPDQFQQPQGFYVLLSVARTQAGTIFDGLGEGGSVLMPLQKTFWSPAFGVVVDRFGIPWEISGEDRE